MNSLSTRTPRLERTQFVQAVQTRLAEIGIRTMCPIVDRVDNAGKLFIIGNKTPKTSVEMESLFQRYICASSEVTEIVDIILFMLSKQKGGVGVEFNTNHILPIVGNRIHVAEIIEQISKREGREIQSMRLDDPKCIVTIREDNRNMYIYFGIDHGRAIFLLCNEDVSKVGITTERVLDIATANLATEFKRMVDAGEIEAERGSGFRTILTLRKRVASALFLAHEHIIPDLERATGIRGERMGLWTISERKIVVFNPNISEEAIEWMSMKIKQEREMAGEEAVRLAPIILEKERYGFMQNYMGST